MAKSLKTDSVSPNLVNREFSSHGAGKIVLTDITYLFYNGRCKAYLSAIRDGYTKQILAYVVAEISI